MTRYLDNDGKGTKSIIRDPRNDSFRQRTLGNRLSHLTQLRGNGWEFKSTKSPRTIRVFNVDDDARARLSGSRLPGIWM